MHLDCGDYGCTWIIVHGSSSHVQRQGIAPSPTSNMAEKAWRLLRYSMCNHVGLYGEPRADSRGKCPSTKRYQEYLTELPPLSINELTLPANSRVLLYGTSYMGQIGHAIFCVNRPQRSKALSFSSYYSADGMREAHVEVCAERNLVGEMPQPAPPLPPTLPPAPPPDLESPLALEPEIVEYRACDSVWPLRSL